MRAALLALCLAAAGAAPALAQDQVSDDCMLKGIELSGKVKVVDNFADLTVKKVYAFADLNVKEVDSLPGRCGEWQFVENFPDFTIKYVEEFADLEVKMVGAFPGKP